MVLTQKISQLALHGLNHIQIYFSYLFSLIFDLHNYGLTLFSLKKLKNIQKGLKTQKELKNNKKGLKTLSRA